MTHIHVCPLSLLDETLRSSQVNWMVSLSAPGKSMAKPPHISGGFLALEFNDIASPQKDLVAPNRSHIEALLKFFSGWNDQERLLIHCWMGISRSTAAALLACATVNPKQDMEALAQNLRRLSPMATPNPLMVELGDEILGLNGRLTSAVHKRGRGENASEGVAFSLELPK